LTAEVVRAMQRYFIALKEAESSEEGVLELLARHIPLAREHQHAFAAAVHTILDATGEVLAAAAEELAMGAAAGASLAGAAAVSTLGSIGVLLDIMHDFSAQQAQGRLIDAAAALRTAQADQAGQIRTAYEDGVKVVQGLVPPRDPGGANSAAYRLGSLRAGYLLQRHGL